MPQGPGTYGKKRGRPPTKGKKKPSTRVKKKGLPKRGQRTNTNKKK
tara:strand:+ start:274 stop:411 length:138 start_codon:yes stop_codon:yes gene_type:complete